MHMYILDVIPLCWTVKVDKERVMTLRREIIGSNIIQYDGLPPHHATHVTIIIIIIM